MDLPPLWRALFDRDFVTAARFVDDGASLDDLIEEDGNTFLHDAAEVGDLQMVDFFLARDCPKTLEQFDYTAKTPLIRAADHGQSIVVTRLLATSINIDSHDELRSGNTAIREAVRGGHTEIVSLLLESGADPTIPGWMGISAVDQAWDEVEGTLETVYELQSMLAIYPSSVRDKFIEQNKPAESIISGDLIS